MNTLKILATAGMTLSLLALTSLSYASPATTDLENDSTKPHFRTSVAVGGYGDFTTDIFYPTLMTSFDGGNKWFYQVEKGRNLPNDFGVTGFFETVSCAKPLCTAGGYYRARSDSYTYPMLAVSQDNGEQWDYKVEFDKNLPNEFNTTTIYSYGFVSTSNSGDISVAGGVYPTADGAYPMLAVSTDGGEKWIYEIEKGWNLPKDMKPGTGRSIESVSCSHHGQLCAAASVYTVDGTPYTFNYPMLAVSTHYGKHWKYKVDSAHNLPKYYSYSDNGFWDVSCSGKSCAAVGAYMATTDNINYEYYPMLLVSTNGGHDWKYKVENHNLPKHFSYSYDGFVDVSCSGRYCAAVGDYADAEINQYPMLIMSTDSGHHWKYKVEFDKNLPHDFVEGYFQTVSCSSRLCAAGGVYEANDGKNYPMLALSNNGGKTWDYKIKKGKNLPSNFSSSMYTEIQNVDCSDHSCTAGGVYQATNGKQYPMLAISTDGGHKWVYKVDSSRRLPHDYSDYGTVLSTSADSK